MQFHELYLKKDVTRILFPWFGVIGFGNENYGFYIYPCLLSAGDI